jgi:carboxylesterase type B
VDSRRSVSQRAGQLQLYNGSRLAANGNVVVVNITYRVGVFGGFELGDLGDGFDDNLCLRDQIAALVWLRDNIAAFSGNAGRVIVFGESAGATSVLALISSPAAEGLFTRAIAQSPALPLLASVASTPTLAHGLTYGVDLLPRHPIEAAQVGATARIPLIIGTNRYEAALFARDQPPMLHDDAGDHRPLFFASGSGFAGANVAGLPRLSATPGAGGLRCRRDVRRPDMGVSPTPTARTPTCV